VIAIIAGLVIAALLGAFNLRAITGWIGGIWLILGSASYWRIQRKGGRFRLPRHQIGMILAHGGIGVFIIGVAMVESTTLERDVRIAPGQSLEVAGMTFELTEIVSVKGPNWIAEEARFIVSRGDRELVRMNPQKRRYHRSGQVMTQVALRPGLFRDLYVAMGEPLDDTGAWSMRIHIKPFVRWIWAGAMLLAIGGLVSASDRRYWRRRRAEQSRPASVQGNEVPA